MEAAIITGVVALVKAGVKLAAEAGQPVDLNKLMAKCTLEAGGALAEFNAQYEKQRAKFEDG